jgi:hypothetical protein
MKTTAGMFILFALASVCLADNQDDRDKLTGSWVMQMQKGAGAVTWVFANGASALHVTQMEGANTIAEFDCPVNGSNCDVKLSGKKATVSMYYNGPALVELETRGDKVIRRRFSISPTGTMKVEVTPMSGTGAHTEELEFTRGQAPEAKK